MKPGKFIEIPPVFVGKGPHRKRADLIISKAKGDPGYYKTIKLDKKPYNIPPLTIPLPTSQILVNQRRVPMKPQELASLVAKKEGHKSQARIGDVREIISILADLMYSNADAASCMVQLGISRAKRKKKSHAPARA